MALGYKRTLRLFWGGFTGVMFRNFFVREISRIGQVVPIDARKGPISSLALPAYVPQQNRPLAWFPEGHISSDGSLPDFKPGIGLLLKHFDVPVVPVHIEGTHEAMPRGKILPRRGRVKVRFGKAIEASELRGDDRPDRTGHRRLWSCPRGGGGSGRTTQTLAGGVHLALRRGHDITLVGAPGSRLPVAGHRPSRHGGFRRADGNGFLQRPLQ